MRLERAKDCSAFSKALLISFTLTQRRPPALEPVPPPELFEPSGFPKTSSSSLLEPVIEMGYLSFLEEARHVKARGIIHMLLNKLLSVLLALTGQGGFGGFRC